MMNIKEYKNDDIIHFAETRKVLFEKFDVCVAGEEFILSKMKGCLIKTRFESFGVAQRNVYLLDGSGLIQFTFLGVNYLFMREDNWNFYDKNLDLSNEEIQEIITEILTKNGISDKYTKIRQSDSVYLFQSEKHLKENGNF